ncbi:lipopolysaccharide biosynthesis protein [Thermus antranikianii]
MAWAGRGFWAFLDQGLFSGANFLINILLARWLPPEEYGAFAVALSVFYLLAGLHTAVLTEPMVVFGVGKYRERFREYLEILLFGHWAISMVISLVLGILAFTIYWLGSLIMAKALAGLALAVPFLLFFWFTRRVSYVADSIRLSRLSTIASGLNLVVVTGGILLLNNFQVLSSFSALTFQAVSALVASSTILFFFGPAPQKRVLLRRITLKPVLLDHWRYGRWAIAETVTYAISNQSQPLLISLLLGLKESGAWAAIGSLYRPISLFMQAWGLVLLPTFARWVHQGTEERRVEKRTLILAGIFAAATALYSLIITADSPSLLNWLFKGKYTNHWVLVPLMGLASVSAVMTQAFLIKIKASQNLSRLPLIWGISAILMITVSVPLMRLLGLPGAAIGYALGYALSAWLAFHQMHTGARSMERK